jgi:hypothetical protein
MAELDMEEPELDLMKVNGVEVEEQYQLKLRTSFSNLETLDAIVGTTELGQTSGRISKFQQREPSALLKSA